jgi:hypothetical protein
MNSNHLWKPLLAAATIWFSLGMACGLAAAGSAGLDAGNAFAVEGVYRYQSLRPAPSPDVETVSQGGFTVYLAPPRWAITYESDLLEPNSNVMHERVEGSFDGTNVFVLKRLNPARFAREHPSESMLLNMASIYAAEIPPVWEREIYRLWLAFVAPWVWKGAEGVTRAPTPDLSLFHHPDSVGYYSWIPGESSEFARRFVLRSPGRILTRNVRDKGQLHYVTLDPPFDQGYVMAKGTWSTETNVGGLQIPLRYSFTNFAPRAEALSETDLLDISADECVVTNIYVTRTPPLPLGLQGGARVGVTDHRFGEQGHPEITYALSNRWSYDEVGAHIQSLLPHLPTETLEEHALAQHGFRTRAQADHQPGFLVTLALGGVLLLLSLGWLLARGLGPEMPRL